MDAIYVRELMDELAEHITTLKNALEDIEATRTAVVQEVTGEASEEESEDEAVNDWDNEDEEEPETVYVTAADADAAFESIHMRLDNLADRIAELGRKRR